MAAFGTEHFFIAAFIQNGGEHLGDGPALISGGKGVNEGEKGGGFGALEQGLGLVIPEGLVQGASLPLGVFPQKGNPPFAQVPLGDVGHPQEGKVVLISGHPQIAQGILDLHTVEEPCSAVDSIRKIFPEQSLLHGPGHIVGPVEHRHIPIGNASFMERFDLPGDPVRFACLAVGQATQHRIPRGSGGNQFLFHPKPVFPNERVGRRQDFRSRAVVIHHQDGLGAGEMLVKFQQVFHISSPPGIDGLVRVAHHKQVLVVAAQHLHELVLDLVDVLKLVDHDIFQPLLPLELDVLVAMKDIQGELDEVIVVQAKALFLLVKVTVENDVPGACGVVILFLQCVQGQVDQAVVIVRLAKQLLHLDHIPRGGVCHVPEGQAPFLVDNLEHSVDIRVVQHQKTLGILDRMTVLLEDGDTKAVKGIDVASVVITSELVDALTHLSCRLIGKGDAQNVPRQNAQLVD